MQLGVRRVVRSAAGGEAGGVECSWGWGWCK